MLVDANVLLYSIDQSARYHAACAAWVEDAFSGARRIALPWQTIGAFLRIATHPRVFARPLAADEAWSLVEQWIGAPQCWIPETSERTVRILGELIGDHDIRGNLVTDAQLAAIAIEHGVPVVSLDSDFARLPQVRWVKPLDG